MMAETLPEVSTCMMHVHVHDKACADSKADFAGINQVLTRNALVHWCFLVMGLPCGCFATLILYLKNLFKPRTVRDLCRTHAAGCICEYALGYRGTTTGVIISHSFSSSSPTVHHIMKHQFNEAGQTQIRQNKKQSMQQSRHKDGGLQISIVAVLALQLLKLVAACQFPPNRPGKSLLRSQPLMLIPHCLTACCAYHSAPPSRGVI